MHHSKPCFLGMALLLLLCCEPYRSVPARRNEPPERARRSPAAEVRRQLDFARATQIPPGNVRISWTYLDLQELSRIGWRLTAAGGEDFRRNGLHVGVPAPTRTGGGSCGSGRETLTRPAPPPAGGGHEGRPRGGRFFELRLHAHARRQRDARRAEQTVLVADGGTASIFIGRVVPLERAAYFGPDGASYTVDLQEIGATMLVTPSIADARRGLVRVRISPELSFIRGGDLERMRIQTEVVVRRGQPIVIGALSGSRAALARALFRFRAGTQVREQVVLLRADY